MSALLFPEYILLHYICECLQVCAGELEKAGRGCQILWSQSYGSPELPKSVMGTEPRLSAGAAVLFTSELSLSHTSGCLIPISSQNHRVEIRVISSSRTVKVIEIFYCVY